MSKFHAIYGKGGVSPEPGGNTYGETQVLLWTNSKPTVEFTNKKIDIDLTSYDGVIVEFRKSTGAEDSTISGRTKAPKGNYTDFGSGYINVDYKGRGREITVVDNSGVTFSAGGGDVKNNTLMIPTTIYGYRQYKKETLTSSVTNQKNGTANTDISIGKSNYAMIARYGADTTAPIFTKGTIVSYLCNDHAENDYGQAILVKSDDKGIINCPVNFIYQIVTVG